MQADLSCSQNSSTVTIAPTSSIPPDRVCLLLATDLLGTAPDSRVHNGNNCLRAAEVAGLFTNAGLARRRFEDGSHSSMVKLPESNDETLRQKLLNFKQREISHRKGCFDSILFILCGRGATREMDITDIKIKPQ